MEDFQFDEYFSDGLKAPTRSGTDHRPLPNIFSWKMRLHNFTTKLKSQPPCPEFRSVSSWSCFSIQAVGSGRKQGGREEENCLKKLELKLDPHYGRIFVNVSNQIISPTHCNLCIFLNLYPIGSMYCRYIYLHLSYQSTVHVGKYAIFPWILWV